MVYSLAGEIVLHSCKLTCACVFVLLSCSGCVMGIISIGGVIVLDEGFERIENYHYITVFVSSISNYI